MKQVFLGFLCVCGMTYAQLAEPLPDCPKSGAASTNIMSPNYHCLVDWDPCTKPGYQYLDTWPTWPFFGDKVSENGDRYSDGQMTTPLLGQALTTPFLDGTNWAAELCEERYEQVPDGSFGWQGHLKAEWKVYDRELFYGDHSETEGDGGSNQRAILSPDGRLPSFSLYNTRTGILRTFVYIGETDHNGDMEYSSFYAEGEISNGNESGRNLNAAYGLLENGMPSGLPLSKANTSGFRGWTSYFESSKPRRFWWVVDQVLPYNEWDLYDVTNAEVNPAIMLRYFLTVKATENIQLDGSMITQEKSGISPPDGLFKGNQYAGVIGSPGFKKGAAQAISGSIGSISDGGVGSLFAGLDKGFADAQLTDIASYAWGGSGLTVTPLAANLATGLLFGGSQKRVTWEESKISLSGSITRQGSANHAEVSLSRRNKVKLPILLRTESGVARDDVEIGLYSFRNSPRITLKRVDYYMKALGTEFFSRSDYFISIEDPTCNLALNTTNGNHFVSLKMIPTLWDKSTDKWGYKGDNVVLQNAAFFASGVKWFTSSDESLHDLENFKAGVEIALELAGEENGKAKPVLSQRVYDADLIVDPTVYKVVESVPGGSPFAPSFEATEQCNVVNAIGSPIRNYVQTSASPRNTVFEVYTKTKDEEYAGTNDQIEVEITTCNDLNTEKVFRYQLNHPHYDEFERNASDAFSFSEPGNIGPIKRVRFINHVPVLIFDSEHSGWDLERFRALQRKVNTGEVVGTPIDVSGGITIRGLYGFPKVVGAREYPGISFNPPNEVVYTYEVPGMETSCNAYAERESAAPPALLTGSYVGIGANRNLNIYGSHFGRSVAPVQVYLGSQEVSVIRVTPEQITVSVPPMNYGRYALKVVVNGVEATNLDAFVDVVAPNTPTTPPTPDPRPSFLTFDENPSTWHSNETSLTPDAQVKVGNSGYGLAINGSDYRVVRSPRFCASELKTYGSKLAVDVYIPSNPGNPWWLGEVALFVDAPSAGVYNSWQGNVQITGLTPGAWHTVEIPLNVQALSALAGSSCDVELGLVLNASAANEPYRFDNLRFTGSELKSADAPVVTNPPASGTGASFVCTGTCLQAEQAGGKWSTMTLNTMGEKWYALTTKPAGWQASEIAGRTLSINGIAVNAGDAFPAAAGDGKWYLRFGAGEHAWASWSHW